MKVDLFDDPIQEVEATAEVPATAQESEKEVVFAVSADEQKMVEFIREKGISMSTLEGLSMFRTQMIARAKRNDVVLKVASDDAKYEKMSDNELLAHIEDRNAIIKGMKLVPPSKPEVQADASNVNKPAGAAAKPGEEEKPQVELSEQEAMRLVRMSPAQAAKLLDEKIEGNK